MKKILITGTSRGLGRSLTTEFYQNGWLVFALARKPQDAEKLGRDFPERCIPIVADVSEDKCERAIREALEQNGGVLDVLINNAGVPGNYKGPAGESAAEVVNIFEVHTAGVYRCTRAALPFLRKSKNPAIVNISSRFGSVSRTASGEYDGMKISYAYRMAKAAQNMFTATLSRDLLEEGIAVCAVHPGRLKTATGYVDADTEPEFAASKMYDLITGENDLNGKYIDLLSGTLMEW